MELSNKKGCVIIIRKIFKTPTFSIQNRVIKGNQKRGARLNEIKLIIKCQKGEKQAFNDLITWYYPYVSKFLIKLTANEEIAQDLVQETFLKLIVHIDKFDTKGTAAFSTYLMQIAKNCYLDYWKKKKKISLELDMEAIADTTSFEEKIEEKNELDEVLKEINKLPFEQAEAIKLKYLEEYSLKEIAEKMKTKPITIKSRLHEGRKKLEKRMRKGGSQNG